MKKETIDIVIIKQINFSLVSNMYIVNKNVIYRTFFAKKDTIPAHFNFLDKML